MLTELGLPSDIALPVAELGTANLIALGSAAVAVIAAFAVQGVGRSQLQAAWERELVDWAHEAVSAAGRAATYASEMKLLEPPAVARERYEVLCALTAAIDRGRLFHENLGASPRTRGRRPEHLDSLVSIFRLIRVEDKPDPVVIRDHQVAFVGGVQTLLGTNDRRRWVRVREARVATADWRPAADVVHRYETR
ncbi:MAG: hypothetical protein ACREH4_00555 [Vitreimonas sp.]